MISLNVKLAYRYGNLVYYLTRVYIEVHLRKNRWASQTCPTFSERPSTEAWLANTVHHLWFICESEWSTRLRRFCKNSGLSSSWGSLLCSLCVECEPMSTQCGRIIVRHIFDIQIKKLTVHPNDNITVVNGAKWATERSCDQPWLNEIKMLYVSLRYCKPPLEGGFDDISNYFCYLSILIKEYISR